MRLIEEFPFDAAGQAVCYLCGNGRRPEHQVVVDLDREIDFEGRLCLCVSCAEELAGLLGCASASETARMRGRIRNLEAELVDALTKTEIMAGRVTAAIHS